MNKFVAENNLPEQIGGSLSRFSEDETGIDKSVNEHFTQFQQFSLL